MESKIEMISAEADGVSVEFSLTENESKIYTERFVISLTELEGKTQGEQESYITYQVEVKKNKFISSRELANSLSNLVG